MSIHSMSNYLLSFSNKLDVVLGIRNGMLDDRLVEFALE